MDIKQLEVFIAVAKHQSFSKAARELFLTQPTVSSHIQNLENELKTVLINRNNKNITLTDSGNILYNHAIVILNDCKKAIYDVNEYSGKIEGSIHMVCSSIPEAYIIPEVMKSFCDKYKNIKFTINHSDSNLVIPEILSERATFGIVGSKTKHPHVEYHDFVTDELILITPKNIELGEPSNSESTINVVDKSNLDKLIFLMRKEGSGTRNVIMKTLASKGYNTASMNVRALVESNEAIIEMVKEGLGCSFVSEVSVKDKIARGEINGYRLSGVTFKRNFYFIFSKKKIFTPTEKKFMEFFDEKYNIGLKLD